VQGQRVPRIVLEDNEQSAWARHAPQLREPRNVFRMLYVMKDAGGEDQIERRVLEREGPPCNRAESLRPWIAALRRFKAALGDVRAGYFRFAEILAQPWNRIADSAAEIEDLTDRCAMAIEDSLCVSDKLL
jgi:hypothetical protein